MANPVVATQIFFGIFTPKIGFAWSNLTIAYFSKGLVQPPPRWVITRVGRVIIFIIPKLWGEDGNRFWRSYFFPIAGVIDVFLNIIFMVVVQTCGTVCQMTKEDILPPLQTVTNDICIEGPSTNEAWKFLLVGCLMFDLGCGSSNMSWNEQKMIMFILNVSNRCWTCMFCFFNVSELRAWRGHLFTVEWSHSAMKVVSTLQRYGTVVLIHWDQCQWWHLTSMSRVAVWKYQVGEVKREVGTAEAGVCQEAKKQEFASGPGRQKLNQMILFDTNRPSRPPPGADLSHFSHMVFLGTAMH